ncbi:RNA12 protein-domain-containing protein [Hyaloraphidium curvatum]|nr:RNA12 protein-domain-containing protein [Hyaloraphidium curvatum]
MAAVVLQRRLLGAISRWPQALPLAVGGPRLWSTGAAPVSRLPYRALRPLSNSRADIVRRSSTAAALDSAAGIAPKTSFDANTDVAGTFRAECTLTSTLPPLTGGNTGRLWIDGVLPLCTGWLDPRRLFATESKDKHVENLQALLLAMSFPHRFVIVDAKPSTKEGGLLLEYTYDGDAKQAAELIQEYFSTHIKRSWLAPSRTVRAFHIAGEPWIDDLLSSYATKRLHVDFIGPGVPQTSTLYNLFRQFGRIADIQYLPPVSGFPRSAVIRYVNNKRDAASAKNSLNGYTLPDGTKLALSYVSHASLLSRGLTFVNSHGRFAVLFFGLAIALVSYLVFDPLRRFFVRNKITGRYGWGDVSAGLRRVGLLNEHVTDLYEAASRNITSILGLRRAQTSPVFRNLVSQETQSEIARLVAVLQRKPECMALLIGPKGSGKTQLIGTLLPDFPSTLVIDVESLMSQTEDEALLSSLAAQTGYKPRFRGLNTIGALADSLLFSLTGTKAGLSTTTEDQFKAILTLVTQALTEIAKSQGAELNAQARLTLSLAGDIENAPGISYPVVVVREAYGRQTGKYGFVNDLIVEWASGLVDTGVANVLLTSRNAAAPKLVSKHTARAPEAVVLHDASFERAQDFMMAVLGKENMTSCGAEVTKVLQTLGGRLEDLNEYISLVKANPQVRAGGGVTPAALTEALEAMVERAVADVRRVGFGIGLEEGKKRAWTTEQFFGVVKLLASQDKVGSDAMRTRLFGGDANPILHMEQEELVSVSGNNISAGRPLLKAAFRRILQDQAFSAGLEILELRAEQKELTGKLQGWEAELSSLQTILFGESGSGGVTKIARDAKSSLADRVEWLLAKCASASRTIAENDKRIKAAESALQ